MNTRQVPGGRSGAALVIALFIMFILLAIALTFFTVSRIQLQTSTNVGNTVRAELLSEAATAIAVNMLKKDALDHPDYTSTDHAWTSYFNGLWMAEKHWVVPRDPTASIEELQGPEWYKYRHKYIIDGGIPFVWYDDYNYVHPTWGWMYAAEGVRLGSGGAGEFIPSLHVPRIERAFSGAVSKEDYATDPAYAFVTSEQRLRDIGIVEIGRPYTSAEFIHRFCDVDNDGDGYNDSMWIPLAQDYFFEQTFIDFNLDRPGVGVEPLPGTEEHAAWETLNEPRPAILFYHGLEDPRNGVDAWYLTAPINDPEGEPLQLYNVAIPGLPPSLTCSAKAPIQDVPGGRYLVDSIDNDYDGVINYHVEYYAYTDMVRDQQLLESEKERVDARKKHILTNVEFERLKSLGFTEISQQYLDPAFGYRVCTTGEPMCELVGRAAVLIRDEASKVNMNAAGAHYVDTPKLVAFQEVNMEFEPSALVLAGTGSFTPFWRPSFGSGVSTGEYLTQVLPEVAEGRSLKFWNMLTGAPNGCMRIGETLAGYVPPDFLYDVTLPGYGFVDDNANALLLAINGIDDNGNGLIDEGTNLGMNLTPEQVDAAWLYADRAEWFSDPDAVPPYAPPGAILISRNQSPGDIARAVYGVFLATGILEGVDEPGEFQYNNPLRNKMAEQVPNSVLGNFGDSPLPNRDYLKRAVLNEELSYNNGGFASREVDRMRPFLTIDSGSRNHRMALDDEGNLETIGPKINYNIATAAQIAAAFIKDWNVEEKVAYRSFDENGDALSAYGQWGARYSLEDANRFLNNQMRVDETDVFPINAFMSGLRVEGAQQVLSGTQPWLPGIPTPENFNWPPADPDQSIDVDLRLKAMQLAVNIADSADEDHARTELTTAQLQQFEYDPWWYVQEKLAGATDDEAKRVINYTVAGAEAIRINEIMVRPVRRIEAESYWVPDAPGNPIFFDPDYAITREPGDIFPVKTYFAGDERTIPTDPANPGEPVRRYGAAASAWDLNAVQSTAFPVGFIGEGAVLKTTDKDIVVDVTENGEPLDSKTIKNVLEYRFGPAKYLPPGRYYLTINTKDAQGNPVLNKTTAQNVKFIVKYVGGADAVENYCVNPNADPALQSFLTVDISDRRILDDLVLKELGLGYAPDFASAIYGRENQRNLDSDPSGWLFLSGEALDEDEVRPGYARDFQAYTVTIPRYATASAEQVFLHVAVYYEGDISELPGDAFSINFFDFSQEPDHEWIEIENVSSQPVNLSGWQVTVGAPDGAGNISSGDKVEMEVPAGTIIDAVPPYNRLLLSVSAYSPPIPDDRAEPEPAFYPAFFANPFLWNGIGQIGTLGYLVKPFGDDGPILDAGDTTVPLIPARHGGGTGPDGRGEPTGASPFEAKDVPKRIVQLKVTNLHFSVEDRGTREPLEIISDWVLGGGVFPNYPEHDGVDNDFDDHILGLNQAPDILGRDGIDHNGDTVATGAGEGVDEGRAWMFGAAQFDDIGAGSLGFDPFGLLYDAMPSLYPIGSQLNLEWKQFIERRFSPGDNVMVSLYQGSHRHKRLVDRITYTERDVINRSIDDGAELFDDPDAPTAMIRPPLHYNPNLDVTQQPYPTFWPDNTMGVDFYRSLERKYHPLYNGDRFGTQNRWQATDGNYDDWSHDLVGANSPQWNGTPLDRNASAWDPTVADNAEALLNELNFVDVRDKPFDSLGDLLSIGHFTMSKTYGEYGAPLSVNAVEGFRPPEVGLGNVRELMDSGVTDAIYLSPGAGTYTLTWPLNVSQAELDNYLAWNLGGPEYPQAWRPHFLYPLGIDDDPAVLDKDLGYDYGVFGRQSLRPPGDGLHWLFNGPASWPAGVEEAWILPRWPIEQRAVLFVSGNMNNFDPNPGAKGVFTWDASSGLQDGMYDLYIDTGVRLLDVVEARLTALGQAVQANMSSAPLFNVTLYTDINGDGTADIGSPTDSRVVRESVGAVRSVSPNSAGYIHCGAVSVHNRRLAVEIENRSPSGELSTFAGVILAPRGRTQGRINVNTVETRLYTDNDSAVRRLNVLAGIPGVLQEYPAPYTYQRDCTFNVRVNVGQLLPNYYEFGILLWCTGDSYYLLHIEKVEGTSESSATFYQVVDGIATALGTTENFADAVDLRISASVMLDPANNVYSLMCNINGGLIVSAEAPIANNPVRAGMAGLMCWMPGINFSEPVMTFTGLPAVPVDFNRGWSGLFWVIEDGMYHFGGGSATTLFTGYPAVDPLAVPEYTTPPNNATPDDERPPFVRAEWLANSRAYVNSAIHWDGRYFESINDLLTPYSDPDPTDPLDDAALFWPLAVGNRYAGSCPDELSTQALLESAWRLSRSANLLTTRSDIFEILVTVQAGSGEDVDGDGIINYRSLEEFSVTSERKTRTIYERP